MAQKNRVDLTVQSAEIRDETVTGANTALRVGTLQVDLVDSFLNITDDVALYDQSGEADAVQGNLDTHTGDGTIHFTVGSIDHTAITNIGTNTHAQIDTHIANVANPHAVKEEQLDGARLTNASVSGATSIDWAAYKVFEFTLTGATTISDTNLPSGSNTRVVEMIITGDFTLTLPAYYEAAPNNDTYDGTKRNHLILSCINGTTSSEDVIYSLQTLTT